MVIRHGELVYEKYWANAWARAEQSWKNVTFSAGKSWGASMGGATFATFDKDTAKRLKKLGHDSLLLA